MEAFKGKYERTSADKYEDFLKVSMPIYSSHNNMLNDGC